MVEIGSHPTHEVVVQGCRRHECVKCREYITNKNERTDGGWARRNPTPRVFQTQNKSRSEYPYVRHISVSLDINLLGTRRFRDNSDKTLRIKFCLRLKSKTWYGCLIHQ